MQLTRTFALGVIALLAFFTFALTQSASAQTYTGSGDSYTTSLSGGNEVPSVATETTGSANISFDENGSNMQYVVTVNNGNEITATHLHCGDPGENGPVVVTLFSNSNGADVDGHLASGDINNDDIADANCASPIGYDIDNLNELANAIDGGRIYVNVHSEAHPIGVARGQLNGSDNDDRCEDGYCDSKHDSDRKDDYDNRKDNHDNEQHDRKGHSYGSRDNDHSYDSDKYHRRNDGRDDHKNDYGKDNEYDDNHDRKDYDKNDRDNRRDGRDGRDGDNGRDGGYSDKGDRRSFGSSAHASVKSFVNANSNIRISVR